MANTMDRHQLADRQHWRGIIEQLRVLRNAGRLMKEGTPV